MTAVDEGADIGVAELLSDLPAGIPWFVAFRLASLRPLCDDALLRHAFKLPDATALADVSHVLLGPAGPVLRTSTGLLRSARDGQPAPRIAAAASLATALADRLGDLPEEQPGCLGYGRLERGPVLLHVTVRGVRGEAVALLPHEPDGREYPLLAAVGATPQEGHWASGGYVARFSLDLGRHLLAGARAGFARTENCNEFFLTGCTVTPRVAGGLQRAAEDRVAPTRDRLVEALQALEKDPRSATLTCLPPPPASPFPYGDLVPLGFVLAGLRAAGDRVTADELEALLRTQRRDGLWSYHRGGLVTAIDSALVLTGFGPDLDVVAALERFRTASGGYAPQASDSRGGTGVMVAAPEVAHWCQPDLPTTYLVTGLRRLAGLPTDQALLARGYAERGGLFFANPYLVDWALARALGPVVDEPVDGPAAARQSVRRRLASELLDSMSPDHAFGGFDRTLSSALALAALGELGVGGSVVTAAHLRLCDLLESREAPARPFYSSLLERNGSRGVDGVDGVKSTKASLTWYRDEGRAITLAAAALALSPSAVPGSPACDASDLRSPAAPHPRYTTGSAEDYVRRFALPPYLRNAPDATGASAVLLEPPTRE